MMVEQMIGVGSIDQMQSRPNVAFFEKTSQKTFPHLSRGVFVPRT